MATRRAELSEKDFWGILGKLNWKKAGDGVRVHPLSLSPKAFELKTGRQFAHLSPKSYESFSNKAGWKRTARTRAGKATAKNVPKWNRRPA